MTHIHTYNTHIHIYFKIYSEIKKSESFVVKKTAKEKEKDWRMAKHRLTNDYKDKKKSFNKKLKAIRKEADKMN